MLNSTWKRIYSQVLLLAVIAGIALPVGAQNAGGEASVGPDPIFDKHERMWKKWILCPRVADGLPNHRAIFCATSKDNKHWFVSKEPALVTLSDSWDANCPESFDVAEHRIGGIQKFVLVYSVRDKLSAAGGRTTSIGLALSSDGRHFEKLSAAQSPYGLEGLLMRPEHRLANGCESTEATILGPRITSVNGNLSLCYGELGYDSKNVPVAACVASASSSDGVFWRKSESCKLSLQFKPGQVSEAGLKHSLTKYSMAYKQTAVY